MLNLASKDKADDVDQSLKKHLDRKWLKEHLDRLPEAHVKVDLQFKRQQ